MRKIRKIIKRAFNLPRGTDFFRYSANKTKHILLRLKKSNYVAMPSSIMFEVTNNGNITNDNCPQQNKTVDDIGVRYAPKDRLLKMIDEVLPYVDSIGLTEFGEAFIYKHLQEVTEYIRAKNKGVNIFITINANMDGCVDKVAAMAALIDSVQISIDGIGEVFNKIRKGANFETFLANLKGIVNVCKGKRAEVVLNMVANRDNYHQMADVVKLADDLGIGCVKINSVNLVESRPESMQDYSFYSSDEFRQSLSKAVYASDLSGVELTTFDFSGEPGFQKCNYPWNHFYVTWDGYMAVCCAKPFPKEKHFGSVFSSDVRSCLNSPGFIRFRELWRMNKTQDFCRLCHKIDLPKINVL